MPKAGSTVARCRYTSWVYVMSILLPLVSFMSKLFELFLSQIQNFVFT
jgi:hypothetical protein